LGNTGRNSDKLGITRRIQLALKTFRNSGTWQPQSIADLDRWMDATLGGQDQGAMSFTSYFSGVLQISQTIASVDAPLLKITNGRRSNWSTHPVYKIFNDMVNPWVDSFKYRENVQMQALNWSAVPTFDP
jgi:hypothetical protein